MLCVPKNRDVDTREIYADELYELIMKIHDKVEKIFIIIEACYSGSVALHLENISNVLIISAAGSKESSYSSKWDDLVGASLSNLFTNHLLSYITKFSSGSCLGPGISSNSTTMRELFNFVSKHVDKSNVNMAGNLNLMHTPVTEVFGNISMLYKYKGHVHNVIDTGIDNNVVPTDDVIINSHDSLKHYYLNHFMHAPNASSRKKYMDKYMDGIVRRKHVVDRIIRMFDGKIINNNDDNIDGGTDAHVYDGGVIDNFQCYKIAINGYKHYCNSIDEVEHKYLLPKLVHYCSEHRVDTIVSTLKHICVR
jgi:hypothetical protein